MADLWEPIHTGKASSELVVEPAQPLLSLPAFCPDKAWNELVQCIKPNGGCLGGQSSAFTQSREQEKQTLLSAKEGLKASLDRNILESRKQIKEAPTFSPLLGVPPEDKAQTGQSFTQSQEMEAPGARKGLGVKGGCRQEG